MSLACVLGVLSKNADEKDIFGHQLFFLIWEVLRTYLMKKLTNMPLQKILMICSIMYMFHQYIVVSRSNMLKKSEKRAQIQELALDLVICW